MAVSKESAVGTRPHRSDKVSRVLLLAHQVHICSPRVDVHNEQESYVPQMQMGRSL